MLTLASAMPGFISFRRYTSEDGETLAVTEFASAEAIAAWRDHPDHSKAQQRGRDEFYSEYEIINCTVMQWVQTLTARTTCRDDWLLKLWTRRFIRSLFS